MMMNRDCCFNPNLAFIPPSLVNSFIHHIVFIIYITIFVVGAAGLARLYCDR